ncbi:MULTISPECIES: extracellular solute-binding protein [Chelativorans]
MKNRLETMRLGAGVMPGIYALIIAGAVAMPAYGQDPSGDLLIYLGHGAVDAQPVVDIFEEQYPGISVTLFEQPTGQLVTTLQLELNANRNRADIIWGGGSAIAELDIRNPDAFLSFEPADTSGIPQNLLSENGRIHTVATIPYVIGYNTSIIAPEDSPRSWLELTDPKWSGMMAMADPATASAVHPFVWFVTTHLADEEGYGPDYWKGIAANDPYLTAGHGELGELLITGERAIAPVTITQMQRQIGSGEPVAFNWATEGTPTSDSSIAVLEAAPNRPAAELFASWLLSPAGQKAFTAGFDSIPVNSDFSPEFFDGTTAADHQLIVPDNAYLAENVGTQVEIVRSAMEAAR